MNPHLTEFRHLALAAVLVASLSACATRPPTAMLPPGQDAAAEIAQQARESALREQDRWSLAGRIAVSTDGKGGSGRIDWRQDGPSYEVALSAPVTRQGWRLSGDAAGALLEGLDGGPRRGPDAALLLRGATGWDIPITALAQWVRGARAEEMGPAQVAYGLDGRLSRLEQGGWTIGYVWPDPAPDETDGANADTPVLPARIEARRDQARVRLVVDEWNPVAP